MNLSRTDEFLHAVARDAASRLENPDRKQLRFNEIVACAKKFYPSDTMGGVIDLVRACDKDDPGYVKGDPMHASLQRQYGWMIDPANADPEAWNPNRKPQPL